MTEVGAQCGAFTPPRCVGVQSPRRSLGLRAGAATAASAGQELSVTRFAPPPTTSAQHDALYSPHPTATWPCTALFSTCENEDL